MDDGKMCKGGEKKRRDIYSDKWIPGGMDGMTDDKKSEDGEGKKGMKRQQKRKEEVIDNGQMWE